MKSLNQWRGTEPEVEEQKQKLFEGNLISFKEFAPGEEMPDAMPGGPSQQPGADQMRPGLAQPAHKADEEGMDLPTMIEKRLEMLMQELEQKSKGALTRDKQVELLSQVLDTLANKFGLNKRVATNVVQQTFDGGAGQLGPGTSATPTAQPQVTQ
jgi:hypothetical protein